MSADSGIVRCAALACMRTVSIAMQFPSDETRRPFPYCCHHAVIIARAFGAEEAENGEDEQDAA